MGLEDYINIDSKLQLRVNKSGKLINEDGHLVDSEGSLVDDGGFRVDVNGKVLLVEGRPIQTVFPRTTVSISTNIYEAVERNDGRDNHHDLLNK